MKQQQEDWTQLLRQRLADHEEAVPEALWDAIEQRLDASASASPRAQRRVLWHRWWPAVAAGLLLLVAGGAVWWWRSLPETPAPSLLVLGEEQVTVSEEPAVSSEQPETNDGPVDSSGACVVRPILALQASRAGAPDLRSPTRSLSPPIQGKGGGAISGISRELDTPPLAPPLQREGSAVRPMHRKDRQIPNYSESAPSVDETQGRASRPQHRAPTVALYAQNGLADEGSHNGVLMSQQMAMRFAAPAGGGQPAGEAPVYLTNYAEQQQHDRPHMLGVRVGYPLNSRLSLTSGVVYTWQHSTFTTIMQGRSFQKEQTLRYVGVPVGLDCKIVGYRGLQMYAAAGLQADWNVSARLQADGVSLSATHDRLRWSAFAGIGLSYAVSSWAQVYAEPGLRHYFGNGSSVQNYFSSHPTTMSLEAGLRFSISGGK